MADLGSYGNANRDIEQVSLSLFLRPRYPTWFVTVCHLHDLCGEIEVMSFVVLCFVILVDFDVLLLVITVSLIRMSFDPERSFHSKQNKLGIIPEFKYSK